MIALWKRSGLSCFWASNLPKQTLLRQQKLFYWNIQQTKTEISYLESKAALFLTIFESLFVVGFVVGPKLVCPLLFVQCECQPQRRWFHWPCRLHQKLLNRNIICILCVFLGSIIWVRSGDSQSARAALLDTERRVWQRRSRGARRVGKGREEGNLIALMTVVLVLALELVVKMVSLLQKWLLLVRQ